MDKCPGVRFPCGEGVLMRTKSRGAFVLIVLFAAIGAAASASAPASTGPDHATASCPPGSKPAIIAGNFKCLRAGQRCKVRYQAAYKKYGFRCVAGHLRKNAPKPPTPPAEPPPAPPPPPTPPAQPGHYKGLTSQLTTFEFDVSSPGYSVTHLKTGQVNAGCTPHFSTSGGEIDLGSYAMNVSSDGNFGVEWNYNATLGGSVPVTGHTKIVGHFNGPTATGTLEDNFAFTYSGIAFTCGSGLQTWTVTKTG
jgi:hypothetical protein